MSGAEIEVPKGVREFMPEWVKQTMLGEYRGARRQYRYGNLHIREYEDRFLVHSDEVDPRRDPLGHLVRDAPEWLVGAAAAVAGGGLQLARELAGRDGNNGHGGEGRKAGLLAAAVTSGYLGYRAAKVIRETHGGSRRRGRA